MILASVAFAATDALWSLKTLARRAAQKRKLLSVITERGKVLKSKDVSTVSLNSSPLAFRFLIRILD